jgi:hypothetical protein
MIILLIRLYYNGEPSMVRIGWSSITCKKNVLKYLRVRALAIYNFFRFYIEKREKTVVANPSPLAPLGCDTNALMTGDTFSLLFTQVLH